MSASMPAYMSDPTDEQLNALNMAMDHKSFKVVAYAGAGKTTTLKLIGERLRGRGLYLAFNKAIPTMRGKNSPVTSIVGRFTH